MTNNSETQHPYQLPIRSILAPFVTAFLGLLLFAGSSSLARAEAPPVKLTGESRNLANLLIKNALISVNQGNLTGNYTVLRDLASPGFRQLNTASDLGVIFGNLRQQKIDLSPIVLLEPVITAAKFSKEQQQLRFKGYFPSEPVQIQFELIFQAANPGGWMIHGVSIGTATVEAQSQPAEATDEESVEQIPSAAAAPRSNVRPASSGKPTSAATQSGSRPNSAAVRPRSTLVTP